MYLLPISPIQFHRLTNEDPNTNSDTNSILPVVKRSVYQTPKRQAGGEFETEYLTRHFHKKKRSEDVYLDLFYYLRRFTNDNLLRLLRNRHTLNNDLTRNRRTSDEYLTRSGRASDEYLTRSGRSSDDYLTRSGRASDEYLTRYGRASDDYLTRNGRASDEYLTRSGRASDEYLTRNGRAPEEYLLTRNGRPCCHFSKNIDRKYQNIEK